MICAKTSCDDLYPILSLFFLISSFFFLNAAESVFCVSNASVFLPASAVFCLSNASKAALAFERASECGFVVSADAIFAAALSSFALRTVIWAVRSSDCAA